MARWMTPTPEQEEGFKAWLAERPPEVHAIAKRFDPWTLYRLRTTGQRVTVDSFCEDGTMKVIVSGKFNFVTHDRRVHNIDPDDLEPCELPGPDALTGTLMTAAEVEENIDELRVAIRPDLWELDADGKAVLRSDVEGIRPR